MKQKLFILIFLILMAAVLVGLNAASYSQKEKTPDSEVSPNRSSFNSGATGTQAFYSLLAETGRKVVRYQKPPAALRMARTNVPSVFVVTGALKREFTEQEISDLLTWVSYGGRLVLIDREPPARLMTTTANWKIFADNRESAEVYMVDPTDQKQMTLDTAALKPVQPTVLTQNVNAIQPSRFAASVEFERFLDVPAPANSGNGTNAPPPPKRLSESSNDQQLEAAPKPDTRSPEKKNGDIYTMPTPTPTPLDILPLRRDEVGAPSQLAPVVHFAAGGKNLVVDAPFGQGRIVYLSDPYIVSNGGISLVDNAQLALNMVAAGDHIIAFDEYHQGYGSDSNRFLQFFAGTPVVAIFLQAALLVGLVFFSQSRRFARPVPEPEPDRLSKLEYVAAMAELQSRTKAFDLAIENIYNEFRRRVTRHFGIDNFTVKSAEIAARITERTDLKRGLVEEALHRCEEIIRGAPTNKREVLRLAGVLRDIEQKLGMKRAGRTRI